MKSYQESKTTGKNPAEERDQNLEEQKVSLPNSYVMRIFDNGGAEDEANTLSTGVRASTPNSLRREMGSRLHADFSSVHFHEGPESVRKTMPCVQEPLHRAGMSISDAVVLTR